MPKVKHPLASLQAWGTLAKALTYRRNRGATIAQATAYPPDAKSLAQLSWRTMYQKAIALWHALSPAEKQTWETDARPRHMTGYAWFMSQALKPNPGLYLPLAGGTMTGEIDMGSDKITNLAAPTDPNDAARLADAGGGTGKKIEDADGDTSWDTEESADADTIVGKVKAVEFFRGHDDGIITTAKQSMAHAYGATAMTVPTATPVRMLLDTGVFDVHSELDTTTKTGTADATEANKLHDADGGFAAADVGAWLWNTTDNTYTTITAFIDSGELTLAADIMTNGETYILYRSTFKATRAGKYFAVTNVQWVSIADQVPISIFIAKNAAYIAEGVTRQSHASAGSVNAAASIIADLAVDDTIDVHIKHWAGVNEPTNSGTTKLYLQVVKIA